MDVDPRNGGLESFALLPEDLRRLILSAPAVYSGRGDGGFHAWMDLPPGAVVAHGASLGRGIDLLPPGHLEMLPPSLHPETGKPYYWHQREKPRPTLALQYLPVPEPRTIAGSFGSGRKRDGAPLPLTKAAEWVALWRSVGINLEPGDRLYRCPWHEDRTPSLSIDQERGLWCCHGGCGSGGLRSLRDRLGVRLCLDRPTASPTKEGERAASPRDKRAKAKPRCLRVAFVTGDGRLESRWQACNMRTCTQCHPLLAESHAAPVLVALEDGATLWELLVPAAKVRAIAVRIARAGYEYKTYPAPRGQVHIFTTAEVGAEIGCEVDDPEAALREAYAVAAHQAGRRVGGSHAWKQVQAKVAAKDQYADQWECLGTIRAGDRLARKQAERVAGQRAVDLIDQDGATLGWTVRLAEDLAEREQQIVHIRFALGIESQQAAAIRRAEHRRLQVTVPREPLKVAA